MATPQPLADRAQSDTAVRATPTMPRFLLTPEQSAASTNAEGSGELTAVVDDLLNQLNNKFTTVSSELLAKSKHEYCCME
jgi:heat shock factor-binding protein 1